MLPFRKTYIKPAFEDVNPRKKKKDTLSNIHDGTLVPQTACSLESNQHQTATDKCIIVDAFLALFMFDCIKANPSLALDAVEPVRFALSCELWCRFALSRWGVFQACMRREFIIMKRNSIVFGFRIAQVSPCYAHTYLSRMLAMCVHHYEAQQHWYWLSIAQCSPCLHTHLDAWHACGSSLSA